MDVGYLGLLDDVAVMLSDEGHSQSRVFGEVAESYHHYRPDYPDNLFDWILATSKISASDLVIDVGCGTGKASAPLLERGYEVVGLEPDPAMAEIAQRELDGFDLFSIDQSTLEDWVEVEKHAGLVIAGQSWHWTDPETRFQRAASMLRPGGWLCVFWNRPESGNQQFDAATDLIYAELAPEFENKPFSVRLPGSKAAISADTPSEEIAVSGLFGPVEQFEFEWEMEISTRHHIENLRTQSDHRMLKTAVRNELLRQVAKEIDNCGGSYKQTFTTHGYAAELSV